jgi:feruloyl esterase
MWGDAVYDDPNWDEETFRRTGDLEAANRVMPELRADRTAIAPFIARGGKAIIYQGWADPSVIAGPTVDYYAALASANGGAERLARSVRLFMVPGMYHCRGGPGADLFGGSGHNLPDGAPRPEEDVLWSLIRWVENKEAPRQIVAAKGDQGGTRFTRLLCPFPMAAVHDGSAETADARHFACKTDALLAAKMRNR